MGNFFSFAKAAQSRTEAIAVNLGAVGRAAARWLAGFQLFLVLFHNTPGKKAQTGVSVRQASCGISSS
jgi:hypothetical protein